MMFLLGKLVGSLLIGVPFLAIFFGWSDIVDWIAAVRRGDVGRLRSDRGRVIR